ncbi:hypothetical protein [Pseudomonas protegens]|uniref:hypothetical protein n=1 Tax=Pseudomonas protegens TaxID=380021 RepID=UPI00215E402E|nr:hypothetical protein [Pseudomonas protegens]UVL70614.1 hypothetical protein LOY23_21535 [Pseudomonas protegens]
MRGLGDLQRLYKTVQQEHVSYWSDLQNTLSSVYEELRALLGIEKSLPVGLNYGYLGEDGVFVRESTDNLPKDNQSIRFALQVVLDSKESINPPNLLVTSWSILGVREGVSLTGETGTEAVYEDSAAAAEAIMKAFENKLSKYSPYIR